MTISDAMIEKMCEAHWRTQPDSNIQGWLTLLKFYPDMADIQRAAMRAALSALDGEWGEMVLVPKAPTATMLLRGYETLKEVKVAPLSYAWKAMLKVAISPPNATEETKINAEGEQPA